MIFSRLCRSGNQDTWEAVGAPRQREPSGRRRPDTTNGKEQFKEGTPLEQQQEMSCAYEGTYQSDSSTNDDRHGTQHVKERQEENEGHEQRRS